MNAKYCNECASARRKHVRSTVTPEQRREIVRRAGTMTCKELADDMGVSVSNLKRCLREEKLSGRCKRYSDELIRSVLDTYSQYGRARTEKVFPEVSVMSIVHRLGDSKPRQLRWRDDEIVEAAKMAGLIRHNAQAKFFNRPGAFGGSIKALWSKRFECSPIYINGITNTYILKIAKPGVPGSMVYHMTASGHHPKVLWLDLVEWMRDDLNPVIKSAIRSLARFQSWLHNTNDSQSIRRMISERENYG